MTATLTSSKYTFRVTMNEILLGTARDERRCPVKKALEKNPDFTHVVVNGVYFAFTQKSTGLRYFYDTPPSWVKWIETYDRDWQLVKPLMCSFDLDKPRIVKQRPQNGNTTAIEELYKEKRSYTGQRVTHRAQRPIK